MISPTITETEALHALVDVLQRFAGHLIDVLTLKGHAITKGEWEHCAMLCGRSDAPMPDWDRDAGVELKRAKKTVESLKVQRDDLLDILIELRGFYAEAIGAEENVTDCECMGCGVLARVDAIIESAEKTE